MQNIFKTNWINHIRVLQIGIERQYISVDYNRKRGIDRRTDLDTIARSWKKNCTKLHDSKANKNMLADSGSKIKGL